jgi:opacity protein-like surface antigen
MFRIIIMLFGIMLSSSVFAITENPTSPGGQFFVGLSPGVAWVSSNKSQTLNLEPDVQKTYTADNNTSSALTGEMFIGWQKPLAANFIRQPLTSQIGISVFGAGNVKLSGDIWEDANPNFNNFNYNYRIQHTHVALKGRLIGNTNFIVDPYISGSIGVGFNRAQNFTIKPKSSSEVPAPPFGAQTTTTFVYTLGIGLQKSLTENLHVALGYEFADWGKTQLSSANGQTLGQGLTLNHLYANQLQLSLFYLV